MSEEREKKPILKTPLNTEVTFTFNDDSFAEIYNKEYDNTNYLHDVLDGDNVPHSIFLTGTLLKLLIIRAGNGKGNKFTVKSVKKDGRYHWEIDVLEKNGSKVPCTYTNIEGREPEDVNKEFKLESTSPAPQASNGNSSGVAVVDSKESSPGTFEGDVGMAVESLLMASAALKHPVSLKVFKDLELGSPMVEQLMTLTEIFWRGKVIRGDRQPTDDTNAYPHDSQVSFEGYAEDDDDDLPL